MSYIAESVQRARTLGQSAEAAKAWRTLLSETHVDEADYSDWCRSLADLYARTGRGLAAGRIHEYLLNITAAVPLYEKYGSPRDTGRILRFGRQLDKACEQYRSASLFAHAAWSAEEGAAHEKALTLYEQLVRAHEAQGNSYYAGLAYLNAGRMAMQISRRDRGIQLLGIATRFLEQEADAREQDGKRDGAFQCYLCLIQIGKIEGSYENLAEGYLNCIRLLKAKSDRFGTMTFYYDFIRYSEELGELHSVAELYREAGEYARRVGFIYSDYFLDQAADAWKKVAQNGLEKGNPSELVENGLLAAVACFNRIQRDEEVAKCYDALAELDVAPTKAERYAKLAKELHQEAALSDQEVPPVFPEHYRRRQKFAEIWVTDLIESEAGQDIRDAIARLVGDHKNVWEVQRRKALLISLEYDDLSASGLDDDTPPPRLLEAIGELQHPAAVRPLTAFYDRGNEDTRVLILERGTNVRQKEVFQLIERGLEEDSPRVKHAAVAALQKMAFAPALDNLIRVFNTFEEAEVRDACLKSISGVGTDEACEFLLDVIRANTGNLALRTRVLLEKSAQERMLSALDRNRRSEPDPALRMFIGRLVDNIRQRRGSMGT
ncbi:MAG: hypothetical protein GY822_07385 [Deltaproteobacteria bacterium]|nr:hypothetical protein [Deltaproteobacteria bacterium]